MAKALSLQRRAAGMVLVALGLALAVSCLVDLGEEEGTQPLCADDDPSSLPVDALLRDLSRLHAAENTGGSSAVLEDALRPVFALGNLDPSMGRLINSIENEDLDIGAFPSLRELDRERRLATLSLALLRLTTGAEASWPAVVVMVYGEPGTVSSTAQDLNEAVREPLSWDEILAQPFLPGNLIHEVARALDELSGADEKDPSGALSGIESPVARWLVAYRAGLMTGGDIAPWQIKNRMQMDRLLYLLGGIDPPAFGTLVPAGASPVPIVTYKPILGITRAGPAPDPCVAEPPVQQVFGLERFTRRTGKPVAVLRSFVASWPGAFCVRVQNGLHEPPHGNRVSSAVVMVDGEEVMGPADFSQQVESIRRSVHLAPGAHSLTVELHSKPGSFIDLDVLGLPDDLEPPSVSIRSPLDLSIVEGPQILVAGDVTDDSGQIASIRVNGSPASLSGGIFSATVPLALGVNEIVATAMDASGNTASDEIAVFRSEGGMRPGFFGRFGPEGGVFTVADPSSGAFGAVVTLSPGSVSGGGWLVISQGNPWAPLPAVALGPPVGVQIVGAELTGEIAVSAPYSGELVAFYRSMSRQVGLFLLEAGMPAWSEVTGAVADPTRSLVEGRTARISIFQAGLRADDYYLDLVMGAMSVAQSFPPCDEMSWADPEAAGSRCVGWEWPLCTCSSGAFGGHYGRSLVERPTTVDSAPWGSGVLVAHNEGGYTGDLPQASGLEFTVLDASDALHQGFRWRETVLHHEPGDPYPNPNDFYLETLYSALALEPSPAGTVRWWWAETLVFYKPNDSVTVQIGSKIFRAEQDESGFGSPEEIAGGGLFSEDGWAAAADLNAVVGLQAAADGSVYFAETFYGLHEPPPSGEDLANRVRRLYFNQTRGQWWLETVAGNGQEGFTPGPGDTSPVDAKAIPLWLPMDVSMDPVAVDGQLLYLADTGNARVRAVNISEDLDAAVGTGLNRIVIPPGQMQTIVGKVGSEPPVGGCEREVEFQDGLAGPRTELGCPSGLALVSACEPQTSCQERYLLISDRWLHRVLVVALEDLTVTTLAGTGTPGDTGGYPAPAHDSQVNAPHGLSYSRENEGIFLADAGNGAIRAIRFLDTDDDGVGEGSDNCPHVANPDQQNVDGDELGDACDPDIDDDGVANDGDDSGVEGDRPCTGSNHLDCDDNCRRIANPAQEDLDGDHVGDACDNCRLVFNPDQRDSDGNGMGNACEAGDVDGDGIPDVADNCPGAENPVQEDQDGDGVGDACDACPSVQETVPSCVRDSDCAGRADGYGGHCVDSRCSRLPDRDRDGVPDACDQCPDDYNRGNDVRACRDSDGDGLADLEELFPGSDGLVSDPASVDGDGDGIPDYDEVNGTRGFTSDPDAWDSDGDGFSDGEAVSAGRDPLENLADPPALWVLTFRHLDFQLEGGNASEPARETISLQGAPKYLVAMNSAGASIQPENPDLPSLSEVDFAPFEAECPPMVFESGCVASCRFLPSAWHGAAPFSTSARVDSPKRWLIDIRSMIVNMQGNLYEVVDCDGDVRIEGDSFSSSCGFGKTRMWDPSLPPVLAGEGSTKALPLVAMKKAQPLQGISFHLSDVPLDSQYCGSASLAIDGSFDLEPYMVEIQDTPANWLPKAPLPWEPARANELELEVRLNDLAGLPARGVVRVTVYDRTSYPGYAMNASFTGADADKNDLPDLLCEENMNPGWSCLDTTDGAGKSILWMWPNQDIQSATITISSFDYAAYGKITAEIAGLSQPSSIVPARPDRGFIRGRPIDESFTTMPIDRGDSQRRGRENKIADWGWMAGDDRIEDWRTGDPSWDIDNTPAYGLDGDDLVALEEYRGFKVYAGGGTHRRTNPFHKDVFIGSDSSLESEGISYAYPALPTSTHRIDLPDMQPSTWSINWLADGIVGHRPQCGLRMIGNLLQDLGPWAWGTTPRDDQINAPGTPCEVGESNIFVGRIHIDNAGHNADESGLIKYTIGHEAGHGVMITHRDCVCYAPGYSLMCTSDSIGPGGCAFVQEPSTYDVDLDLRQLNLINP